MTSWLGKIIKGAIKRPLNYSICSEKHYKPDPESGRNREVVLAEWAMVESIYIQALEKVHKDKSLTFDGIYFDCLGDGMSTISNITKKHVEIGAQDLSYCVDIARKDLDKFIKGIKLLKAMFNNG